MPGPEVDFLSVFRRQKDQQASQLRVRDLLQKGSDSLTPEQLQMLEQMVEPLLQESQSLMESLFDTRAAAPVVIKEIDGNRGESDTWTLQQKLKKYFKKSASSLSELGDPDFDVADYLSYLYHDEDDTYSEEDSVVARLRNEEAELMAKLVVHPGRDGRQLQHRQQLLETLAASEHIDDLLTIKNQAYNAHAGIRNLLSHYSTEPQQPRPEQSAGSPDSLINIYHRGITEIPETVNELGWEWSEETTGRKLSVQSLVQTEVARIQTGLQAIEQYEQLVQAIPNELIHQAFADLPDVGATVQQIVAVMGLDQPLGQESV